MTFKQYDEGKMVVTNHKEIGFIGALLITYAILILIGVLCFLFFMVGSPIGVSSADDLKWSHTKDLGEVVSIDNCRVAKYAYFCDVKTTKYITKGFDVSDFPSDSLNVGDRVSRRLKYSESRDAYESYLCKGDACRLYSMCADRKNKKCTTGYVAISNK